MNKSKKNILFKCDTDSGKFAGTGHLKRINEIFRSVKKKYKNKYNYHFLFKKLNDTESLVRKTLNHRFLLYTNDLNKKLNFINKQDVVINDTPDGIGYKFDKILKKKKIKRIITFDDLKKYKCKNITYINSLAYFKKKIITKSIYQGLKYIPTKQQNKKYKITKTQKLNILICTGGADYKHILVKLVRAIKDLDDLKLNVVIGSGVKKNNPIFKIRSKNIKIHKNLKTLNKLLQINDLSLVTGGLIMYESLAQKKVTLVHQSYNHQANAVKKFSKEKSIYKIGQNDKIFKNKLVLLIKKMIKYKYLGKEIKNIKSKIDGKGYVRVKKIVYDKINEKNY